MYKIVVFLFLFLATSAQAQKPMWTCYDHLTKYEIDWNPTDLVLNDQVFVDTKDQRIIGTVLGMSENMPDILFFDPNKGTQVVLFIDSVSEEKPMFRYQSNEIKELISYLNCKDNY
jgi:hypothetical protein